MENCFDSNAISGKMKRLLKANFAALLQELKIEMVPYVNCYLLQNSSI